MRLRVSLAVMTMRLPHTCSKTAKIMLSSSAIFRSPQFPMNKTLLCAVHLLRRYLHIIHQCAESVLFLSFFPAAHCADLTWHPNSWRKYYFAHSTANHFIKGIFLAGLSSACVSLLAYYKCANLCGYAGQSMPSQRTPETS